MRFYLIKTCEACPEQYEVFNLKGEQCGYIRLRSGIFRVDVPNCGDKTILEYLFEDKYKGSFEDEERSDYINLAVMKIQEYMLRKVPCETKELIDYSYEYLNSYEELESRCSK